MEYEQYTDDDPNVIGIAESEDRTVVFISAPASTLNWQKLTLFPTFDSQRVIVATPEEPLLALSEEGDKEQVLNYLNGFLSEAILMAEEHFATAGAGEQL